MRDEEIKRLKNIEREAKAMVEFLEGTGFSTKFLDGLRAALKG